MKPKTTLWKKRGVHPCLLKTCSAAVLTPRGKRYAKTSSQMAMYKTTELIYKINVTLCKLANKIKVRSSNVCWSSDSNLQHTTKHISKKYTHNSSYPAQSSGLLWQNGYFCLFHYTTLSEMPFFCLKQSQGFEDLSSTQSLPKLPFSLPPVKKQNYITPGGCSEGVTGKRRESLKTFMLKNGHCHFWR